MKTWLKGGAILSLIFLIVEIFDYLILPRIICGKVSSSYVFCIFPLKATHLLLFFVGSFRYIIDFVVLIVFYFVVGALIGLAVEKFRKK